jgi:hypothetical protein
MTEEFEILLPWNSISRAPTIFSHIYQTRKPVEIYLIYRMCTIGTSMELQAKQWTRGFLFPPKS